MTSSTDHHGIPGPAWLLVAAVRDLLDERYPHRGIWPRGLPAGLRLEIHPVARWMILSDPYSVNWPSADVSDWQVMFGVPVKVNPELDKGHWRLVIVTEDVLTGGKLAP